MIDEAFFVISNYRGISQCEPPISFLAFSYLDSGGKLFSSNALISIFQTFAVNRDSTLSNQSAKLTLALSQTSKKKQIHYLNPTVCQITFQNGCGGHLCVVAQA